MSQVHGFWTRNWESGSETSMALVLAEDPGEFGFALDAITPLNSHLALYANALYITPSTSAGDTDPNGVDNSYSEETWNITFGLVFYPGAKARSKNISGPCNLPLMPVADNGSFMVSAPTGNL